MKSKHLLCLVALLCLLSVCSAALYDKKRGFKTYKLDPTEYLKHSSHHAELARHKNKEALKGHPDVQKYLEWRQKHKAGDPDAAAAFVGQLPHDFIPHLSGDPVDDHEL